MTFDTIVFTQKELDFAVEAGYKCIALCDGSFKLPDRDDITYVSIGVVSSKRVKINKKKHISPESGAASYGVELI